MTNSLRHILCVDDEIDILDVARMCLETVGQYTVTCLSSGQEACASVLAINPDIILLDVMMPGMDGQETLKCLRKVSALDHIPVVFMTARAQPAELAEYKRLGAANVIIKPFDPMTLSKEVAAIYEAFHAH